MRLNIDIAAARARTTYAFIGYDPHLKGWAIPWAINAHVHLRCPKTQRNMFTMVVAETAKLYRWATAMPNLGDNRILLPEQALAYKGEIEAEGRTVNPRFEAVVPFCIEPGMSPAVIGDGFRLGAWVCGKMYPKHGTTNSDAGVDFRKIEEVYPQLAIMEELDLICLIHAEMVFDELDELIVDRLREALMIPVIYEILRRFPKLRIVVEHITSAAMANAVKMLRAAGYRIEATIAPQYPIWNSSVLFERGMHPGRFSIPVLKDEEDRQAILAFILDGYGMLGTDSAPHDITKKCQYACCPGGLFNEPTGLLTYFHLFRTYGDADWFEKFVDFACYKACRFYGMPVDTAPAVLITENEWNVPELYQNGDTKVVPMFAGTKFPYQLEQL